MQPAVSSIPSTTWLGQPSYDTVKAALQTNRTMDSRSEPSDLTSLSSITSNEQEQEGYDEMSSATKIAAVISGFHPDICQQILLKFDQIKKEQEQTVTSPSHSEKHAKHKLHLRRQRSQSTSAIN